MSKILTTDQLVKSLQRRAMLPKAQDTFSKDDFIDILNEEMEHGLVPHVMAVHEEFLVYYEDRRTGQHVTTENTEEFIIPSRAVGNKLRGLQLVGSSGNIVDLTRVKIEDLLNYNYFGGHVYGISSFYVKNNTIVLLGTSVVGTNTLRMWYYMRPSRLVEDKYAGVVVAINSTTGDITLDKIPSTFNASLKYDMTMAANPNKLLQMDAVPTALSTTAKTIRFDVASIPSTLAVGDYITVAETSIVPQLPQEVHPLLAQRAAVACLEALNDTEAVNLAVRKLKELEERTWTLLDNRVESAVEKITSVYTPLGRFRNVRRMRRGGY